MKTLRPKTPHSLIAFYAEPDNTLQMSLSMARGACTAANCLGYSVVVSDNFDLFTPLEAFSGFINFSHQSDTYKQHDAFQQIGRPTVSLSGAFCPNATMYVDLDNQRCFTRMTQMLIDSGHRRIGFVGGQHDHPDNLKRLKGFRDAHKKNGLTPDETTIWHTDRWMYDEVRRVLPEIIDTTSELDALVCASDGIAFAVMELIQDSGRTVPEDVSVIGFDNFAFRQRIDPSLSDPSLTSGVFPSFEMGYRAVELLHEHLKDESKARKMHVIQPGIAYRMSTQDEADEGLRKPHNDASFKRLTTILGDINTLLITKRKGISEIANYFIQQISSGYNDSIGFAIFQSIRKILEYKDLESLPVAEIEICIRRINTELRFSSLSKNYRDFHLDLRMRIAESFQSNTFSSSKLACRADIADFVNNLRHSLGIETLCLEFTEANYEFWLLVEAETPRCLKDRACKKDVCHILHQDNIILKAISVEGKHVGKIYIDFSSQRELDAGRLANIVSLAYTKAEMTSQLEHQNNQLMQEKQNAELARDLAETASSAKSSFLAMMSHEIRTPMNGVMGCASLLGQTPMTHEQRSLLDTVQSSGESLLTIIDEILDFSKIEAGKIRMELDSFNLRECIEEANDLFTPEACRKSIGIAIEIDPTIPVELIGDASRIRQILINLISNALKFTEHGEIITKASRISTNEKNEICRICIAVIDTGIGISTDAVQKLFDPFVQADATTTRRFGGTGLGLSICKQLAEMMNGSMSVKSEKGHGSTFSLEIELEISDENIERDEELIKVPSVHRALLVDQSEVNLKIISSHLELFEVESDAYQTSEEAIRALNESTHYDVGIFDQDMPDLDGLSLARVAHTLPQTRNLQVIILTSHGNHPSRVDCIKYIRKPVKLGVLNRAVASITSIDSSHTKLQNSIQSLVIGQTESDLRILVAEDNKVNQNVAKLMLRRCGMKNIVTVNDGEEAISVFKKDTFDAILMDVSMPKMDGLEATKRIRKIESSLGTHSIILGLSAGAMRDDHTSALEAGMDGYLAKPIRLQEFTSLLESLLSGRDKSPLVNNKVFD